jgi:hypothetical protein
MGFDIGRPRIAAAVADACDFPRGADFLLSVFFTVTIQNVFSYKSGSSRARECIKENQIRH